jgi:hypothetical protein
MHPGFFATPNTQRLSLLQRQVKLDQLASRTLLIRSTAVGTILQQSTINDLHSRPVRPPY